MFFSPELPFLFFVCAEQVMPYSEPTFTHHDKDSLGSTLSPADLTTATEFAGFCSQTL